jgi:hypothetical protein
MNNLTEYRQELFSKAFENGVTDSCLYHAEKIIGIPKFTWENQVVWDNFAYFTGRERWLYSCLDEMILSVRSVDETEFMDDLEGCFEGLEDLRRIRGGSLNASEVAKYLDSEVYEGYRSEFALIIEYALACILMEEKRYAPLSGVYSD